MNIDLIVFVSASVAGIGTAIAVGRWVRKGQEEESKALWNAILGSMRDQERRHEYTQSMLQKANLAARKPLPEVWEPEGLDVMPVATDVTNPYHLPPYTPTPTSAVPPTHAMHRPMPAETPKEKPISGAEERERLQRAQLNGASLPEPRRIG